MGYDCIPAWPHIVSLATVSPWQKRGAESVKATGLAIASGVFLAAGLLTYFVVYALNADKEYCLILGAILGT